MTVTPKQFAALQTSIKLQGEIATYLFKQGMAYPKAQSAASEIIGMLYDTDIPRAELLEAYNNLPN